MSQVAKPGPKKRRWLVIVAIGMPASLLLLCLCAGLGYWWQGSAHRQELAQQEQRVRDAGEPLDGVELNEWYRIPEGDEDLTSLYVSILEPFAPSAKKQREETTGIPFFDAEIEKLPLPGRPWKGIERSEAFLAQYESTLQLPQILEREGSARYPADFRNGLATLLPYAQSLRPFAKVCCLRALVLCHRGDYALATDSLMAAMKAGESVKNEPCLVSVLVRLSIHGQINHTIACALSDEKFPVEQIRRLQTELMKIDRDSASRVGAIGERAIVYTAMSKTYDALMQEIRVESTTISGITSRPVRDLRPGDCALLLSLMTDAVEACGAEYPQKWRDQQSFVGKADTVMAQEQGKKPWNANLVTVLMLPAYETAFRFFAEGAAEHRCMIVLLSAEQHRREQGAYPQQLSDLSPRYLAELPIDPFTGESLRMRQDEQRFMVYSVRTNEQDDGGDIDSIPGRLPLDVGFGVPPHLPNGEDDSKEPMSIEPPS